VNAAIAVNRERDMKQVPAIILTGFLGAGKTTMLKRWLEESHGQKIAVIENEFGEENIDKEMLVTRSEEQIYQLSNGCVCCTIREDLRAALQLLAARRREGALDFDRVVIETTGLADPGPVAQTFFADDSVSQDYVLDSIVTVVDAKHAHQQLNQRTEAARQIGFADQIFISKTDLVSAADLNALTNRIRQMNPRARLNVVQHGNVAIKDVFDLRGFSLDARLEIAPGSLTPECDDGHPHHDHACEHGENCTDPSHGASGHHVHHAHHHYDDDVKSFVFRSERSFDPARLEAFLTATIKEHGASIMRCKGVLAVSGVDRKLIFQGVHQMTGSSIGPRWKPEEKRESRMVFIGIDLPRGQIENGLVSCLE
jgi:G3E family GTPase